MVPSCEANLNIVQRGDELVGRLCSGSDDPELEGRETHELLSKVFSGYPVERIRPLLRSSVDSAVKHGVWIASESAPRAASIMDDIDHLLHHESPYVRYYAIDSVLTSSTASHGSTIAKAILLLSDPDPDPDHVIRRKVLELLANARIDQLQAGIAYVESEPLLGQLRWLTSTRDSTSERLEIIARLDEQENLSRLIAAVAAARIASRDPHPLDCAAASQDWEIRSFAKEQRRRFGS